MQLQKESFSLSMARVLPALLIVYGADVTTTSGNTKVYIGMTEHTCTLKTRYNNNKLSINHCKHSNDTFLSTYIWDQKDNGTVYMI